MAGVSSSFHINTIPKNARLVVAGNMAYELWGHAQVGPRLDPRHDRTRERRQNIRLLDGKSFPEAVQSRPAGHHFVQTSTSRWHQIRRQPHGAGMVWEPDCAGRCALPHGPTSNQVRRVIGVSGKRRRAGGDPNCDVISRPLDSHHRRQAHVQFRRAAARDEVPGSPRDVGPRLQLQWAGFQGNRRATAKDLARRRAPKEWTSVAPSPRAGSSSMARVCRDDERRSVWTSLQQRSGGRLFYGAKDKLGERQKMARGSVTAWGPESDALQTNIGHSEHASRCIGVNKWFGLGGR